MTTRARRALAELYSFEERALAYATGAPSRESIEFDTATQDQIDAATAHAEKTVDGIGDVLAEVHGMTDQERIAGELSPEQHRVLWGRVMAALDWAHECKHVRDRGPSQVILRLPQGRVDCERCVRTVRAPVVDSACCDWCRGPLADGMSWSVAMAVGVLIVIGDVCDTCRSFLPEATTPVDGAAS
jgi:hypothetical protein